MTKDPTSQFTHSHIVLDDGTVTFKCSSDRDQWPWLALDPSDPIVVQTINYWASVESGAARGTFDQNKWSALTQTEWTCGKLGAGHATHGVAGAMRDEETPRYQLTFFDADGALVYHMTGTGVVFKTRDFEAWREKAKKKPIRQDTRAEFQYATAAAVGVATQGECFVSSLIEGPSPHAQALITKENGFLPAHPYHSGSGDHVNSNHLADVCQQFVSLLLEGATFTITGGEMNFTRYVELGRPFQTALVNDRRSETSISMIVQQEEKSCAEVTLRIDRQL